MRTFLAFKISEEIRKHLEHLVAELSALDDSITWVKPQNMHVTIKFMGDVEESHISDIIEKVAPIVTRTPAFSLHCLGIGIFPNWKYPKVIWAGLSGEVDAPIALHNEIEAALADMGLKKDEREFRLHLTIGRTKGIRSGSSVAKRVEALEVIDFGSFNVSELTLFKSELGADGPLYTPVKKFELKK